MVIDLRLRLLGASPTTLNHLQLPDFRLTDTHVGPGVGVAKRAVESRVAPGFRSRRIWCTSGKLLISPS